MNMPIGGWQPSQLPLRPGSDFGGQDALPLHGKNIGELGEKNNILTYGSSLPQAPVMLDGTSKPASNHALNQENPGGTLGDTEALMPQMGELVQMMIMMMMQFLTNNTQNNNNESSNGNNSAGDNTGHQGGNQNQPLPMMTMMQLMNALISQLLGKNPQSGDENANGGNAGGGGQPGMQTPQQPLNTPQQGLNTPQQPLNTPQQGLNTPQQPLNTPQQGLNTPQQPLNTPQQGLTTPQPGVTKPQPGVTTPQPGVTTPQPELKTEEQTAASETRACFSSSAVNNNANIDPNKNSLTFENKGKEEMTIRFTPNEGISANMPDLKIKPGETKTVTMDEGWEGNFRSTKGDGKNVTPGEVKFNGGDGNTFYDVSYIEGNNARMQMQPVNGGRVSGTLEDLVKDAPDSIKARDENGEVYGLKKSTHAEQIDENVVKYYRTKVDADQGYVVPLDNDSTLGTNSRNLKVDLM